MKSKLIEQSNTVYACVEHMKNIELFEIIYYTYTYRYRAANVRLDPPR